MLKRITCLMAALLLVISSGAPAMAATPQEGWFIAGIENVDGIDYYVIDNKMSMDPWLVDFYTQRYNLRLSGVDLGSGTSYLDGFFDEILLSSSMYQGFSDYTWRIDEDWILKIWPCDPDPTYHYAYKVIVYDRTQIPFLSFKNDFTVDSDYGDAVYQMWGNWSMQQVNPSAIAYKDSAFAGPVYGNKDFGSWHYEKVSNFTTRTITGVQTVLTASDINDICITVVNQSSKAAQIYDPQIVKCAFQWLCPVDKAPSGMTVGDSWPKIRPLEVEIADAYDAYKQTMLANGQIRDPSDINSMFGQLGGMQEDGLGALELGDGQAEWVTGVYTMLQPLFLYLLPIVGLGVVLIIFANKGMHG